MLISSPHNLNLCSDSQDTRFLWNVFEAVQKTRSTCFIGFKNTRLRLVFLNPIKHCCSCFKQYFIHLRDKIEAGADLMRTITSIKLRQPFSTRQSKPLQRGKLRGLKKLNKSMSTIINLDISTAFMDSFLHGMIFQFILCIK